MFRKKRNALCLTYTQNKIACTSWQVQAESSSLSQFGSNNHPLWWWHGRGPFLLTAMSMEIIGSQANTFSTVHFSAWTVWLSGTFRDRLKFFHLATLSAFERQGGIHHQHSSTHSHARTGKSIQFTSSGFPIGIAFHFACIFIFALFKRAVHRTYKTPRHPIHESLHGRPYTTFYSDFPLYFPFILHHDG